MMLPSRYVLPSPVPGRMLLVTVRNCVLRVPTFAVTKLELKIFA